LLRVSANERGCEQKDKEDWDDATKPLGAKAEKSIGCSMSILDLGRARLYRQSRKQQGRQAPTRARVISSAQVRFAI